MSPNWNMGEVLGHRIRGLVPYRTDLANLIHFARLFQSQLIAVRLFGFFIFMITNKNWLKIKVNIFCRWSLFSS